MVSGLFEKKWDAIPPHPASSRPTSSTDDDDDDDNDK
jgi:hypothetical protein